MKTWSPNMRRAGLAMLLACFTLTAPASSLRLVSALDPSQDSPAGGSGDSLGPIISPDGRYVLFASWANNLVSIDTSNAIPARIPCPLNVFLRDRTNGTTTLISMNSSGNGGGNSDSIPVAISTNGGYVLFESSADNLVPGDTNKTADVFVRDLVQSRTLLVSAGANGGSANGPSQGSSMTSDGRYVAFLSGAGNLVPDDTNGIPDVFVRDLQTGRTTLVSVGAKPSGRPYSTPTDAPPGITPDGRYVVFHSTATNLVNGVGTADDIYVRDMIGGTTVQASVDARAAVQSVLGVTDAVCFNYGISADGQFVAFEAGSTTAFAGVVLRYSLLSGLTDLVHTNVAVTSTTGESQSLDMTPDGRFLAFVANTNGALGADTCILVWDAQTGATTLASGDLDDTVPEGSACDWPTISPNGRFVAFLSSGINLVTNDLAGDSHLYLRDIQAGATTLVDSDTNGIGAVLTSMPIPALSDDGRFVAFECPDGSLVPGDNNRTYDVVVRDLEAGATELVSVRDPALPSLTPNGNSSISISSVAANGRYIAFESDADNLLANDNNGCQDVFVRDLLAGATLLVSAATNGIDGGDGLSAEPSVSPDGRYVAFTSGADNLVAGDTNRAQDVFVRDLQTGTTLLVSANVGNTGPGDNNSYSPIISPGGRYVLFRSLARNLAPGIFSYENLFLRDLQLATNYALSSRGGSSPMMTPDGRFIAFLENLFGNVLYIWDTQSAKRVYTNTTSGMSVAAISPDGNWVLYWTSTGLNTGLYAVDRSAQTNTQITACRAASRPGLRFSADGRYLAYAAAAGSIGTPTTNQVYLYDFQAGTNLLVSQSCLSSGPAKGSSDSPDVSADGRFVAYRSYAADIVPGDTNGVPDIFLFDRLSGATTLVSASRFGNSSANDRSLTPVFSGDGKTLVFESWASDLTAGDFNFSSDVFALSLDSSSSIAAFQISITGDTQGPWITWPALPGKNYRVQYKNSLSDPDWNDLGGGVSVVGDKAYLKDLAPAAGQRFYRVAAF